MPFQSQITSFQRNHPSLFVFFLLFFAAHDYHLTTTQRNRPFSLVLNHRCVLPGNPRHSRQGTPVRNPVVNRSQHHPRNPLGNHHVNRQYNLLVFLLHNHRWNPPINQHNVLQINPLGSPLHIHPNNHRDSLHDRYTTSNTPHPHTFSYEIRYSHIFSHILLPPPPPTLSLITPQIQPTSRPSRQPLSKPSGQPSRRPSRQPTKQPVSRPSSQPIAHPTSRPTRQPSSRPSRLPTYRPSSRPTHRPSCHPTTQPSSYPTSEPTNVLSVASVSVSQTVSGVTDSVAFRSAFVQIILAVVPSKSEVVINSVTTTTTARHQRQLLANGVVVAYTVTAKHITVANLQSSLQSPSSVNTMNNLLQVSYPQASIQAPSAVVPINTNQAPTVTPLVLSNNAVIALSVVFSTLGFCLCLGLFISGTRRR